MDFARRVKMKIGDKIKERTADRNDVGDDGESEEDKKDKENEGTEQSILMSGRDWQEVTDILARKGFIGTIKA